MWAVHSDPPEPKTVLRRQFPPTHRATDSAVISIVWSRCRNASAYLTPRVQIT